MACLDYCSYSHRDSTFLPLWEMLQIELAQLASIHGEYAAVLTEQIEQPLRAAIPNNRDYADIHQVRLALCLVGSVVCFDWHSRYTTDGRPYAKNCSRVRRSWIQNSKAKEESKGRSKDGRAYQTAGAKAARVDQGCTWILTGTQAILESNNQDKHWHKHIPLQKHQKVDEFGWENLKTTIYKFESIQQTHAEKMIEMAGNTMTAAANLRVDDEIAAFCASHSSSNSRRITPHHQVPNTTTATVENQAQLINTDHIVPEPSVSDMSLKSSDAAATTHHNHPPPPPSVKKDKKRCKWKTATRTLKKKALTCGCHIVFSSLVSIRRKPKSDANLHQHMDQQQGLSPSDQSSQGRRQRSFSNAGSFVESASLHSINTHSTVDHHDANIAKSASANNIGQQHHYQQHVDLMTPNSPTSLNNAPSLKGSFTNESSSQPVSSLMLRYCQ